MRYIMSTRLPYSARASQKSLLNVNVHSTGILGILINQSMKCIQNRLRSATSVHCSRLHHIANVVWCRNPPNYTVYSKEMSRNSVHRRVARGVFRRFGKRLTDGGVVERRYFDDAE